MTKQTLLDGTVVEVEEDQTLEAVIEQKARTDGAFAIAFALLRLKNQLASLGDDIHEVASAIGMLQPDEQDGRNSG
jgi:hypothetical protein